MDLYRGKDIGGRAKLEKICLDIIARGVPFEIYDILPHIRILRAEAFFEPLLQLLHRGDTDQKAAAARALGSLGDEQSIDPLKEAFHAPSSRDDRRRRLLQEAIIEALGELASKRAAAVLSEIWSLTRPLDPLQADRLQLVISALGQLAQQGITEAESELVRLLADSRESVRIQAVTELSVAFWHRPNEIPETTLRQILQLATTNGKEGRMAAVAALSNLSRLGCTLAGTYLKGVRRQLSD